MKIMHLSDLHLGKRVNEYSLLEEQEYILMKITNVIDDERPQVVIIAGDVYDKSVPSAEAVRLFDDFLVRLAQRELQVFVISGNHDSPERIAFGNRLMDASGIHMSPMYNGKVEPVTLFDENGEVNFYMLPFVKPINVRRFFPDDIIESYTDAIRIAIANMNVDSSKRNVLVTHQFVTGAARSDSEDINIGGSDNIDVNVFENFDYVALGHIHGPQNVCSERVRYCGTPLKYSFSEVKHKKSVTIVALGAKDDIQVRTVELVANRDWMEIKGTYNELIAKSYYNNFDKNSFMHIILKDENDIPDAIGKLRIVYPNLMKLDYDNTRTRSNTIIDGIENIESKTPLELFEEFFEKQNNQEMTSEQRDFANSMIKNIWRAD
ncbi:MAG: exonuclease SbcCD subunit D [Clostridia bacterium]